MSVHGDTLVWVMRAGLPGERLAQALSGEERVVVHAPLFTCIPQIPARGWLYTDCSLLIFFSPYAVQASVEAVFAEDALFFAVGQGTAEALHAQRQCLVTYPESASGAEALWGLSFFAEGRYQGHRALLIKGEGGRSFFYDRLLAASVEVITCVCYRRAPVSSLPLVIRSSYAKHLVCILSSTESLTILQRYRADMPVSQLILVCCHPRIYAAAQSLTGCVAYLASFEQKSLIDLLHQQPWLS